MDKSCDSKSLKGISPVIAIILMVMITVVLVAFAYSWLQDTVEDTTENTGEILSNTEKMNQKVSITTAYRCDDDGDDNDNGGYVCFELKALSTNSYSVEMDDTTYYINGVPVTEDLGAGWTGTSCNATGGSLAPNARCYGMIDIEDCEIGAVLKVSLPWGSEASKSISGCS